MDNNMSISSNLKRRRKIELHRLVYANYTDSNHHERQQHRIFSSSLHNCDINQTNLKPEEGTRKKFIIRPAKKMMITMGARRGRVMMSSAPRPNGLIVNGVKIFILVSILANFYQNYLNQHHLDQPSLLLHAEAGSKSKSSSKTTVIAIDGGHGHAQPIPVPWPIVHCHHHHHHLKYVPKPILVHHWVKKQKLPASSYEFAASDKHPDLELSHEPEIVEKHKKEHQIESEEVINPMTIMNSLETRHSSSSSSSGIQSSNNNNLPYELAESGRLVSRLNSVFDDNQLKSAFSPATAASSNRVQTSTSNSPDSRLPVKSELASDRENYQQKNEKQQSNSTKDNDHQQQQKQKLEKNHKQTGGSSSSPSNQMMNQNQHTSGKTRNKNIEVRNAQGGVLQSDLLAKLAQANKMEQIKSEKLFRKVRSEQEGRMQALNVVNQLLQAGLRQQQQQQQPSQSHNQLHQHQQLQTRASNLFGSMVAPPPQISKPPTGPNLARVAGMLSESKTIETMIKLAEQMARAEAKRLLAAEQQRKSALPAAVRSKTSNARDSPLGGGLLRGLNLFSKFHNNPIRSSSSSSSPSTRLKYRRNRRRRDSSLVYNSALQDLKNGPLYEKLRKESEIIRLFNLTTAKNFPRRNDNINNNNQFGHRTSPRPLLLRGPSSGLMPRGSGHLEQLSAQESSPTNKIVDPSSSLMGANTITKKDPKQHDNLKERHAAGSDKVAMKNVKVTTRQDHGRGPVVTKATEMVSVVTELQPPMRELEGEANSLTTMSTDQEDQFYDGQENHLMKQRRQIAAGTTTPSSLVFVGNQTRIYSSSPSDLHNFVVEPPPSSAGGGAAAEATNDDTNSSQNQGNNSPAAAAAAQSGGQQVAGASVAQHHQNQQQHQQLQQSMRSQTQQQWEQQQRRLRSAMDYHHHLAQQAQAQPSLINPVKSPGFGGDGLDQQLPVVATSEGGRLYQNFAENMMPMPSYLEFPMSPQLWSTEAMKSMMNEPTQTANGSSSSSLAESSQEVGGGNKMASDSQSQPQTSSDSSAQQGNEATMGDEALYDLSNGNNQFNPMVNPMEQKVIFEQLLQPSSTQNLVQPYNQLLNPFQPFMASNNVEQFAAAAQQQQQQQQPIYDPNSPTDLMLAQYPHTQLPNNRPAASQNPFLPDNQDLSYLFGPMGPLGLGSSPGQHSYASPSMIYPMGIVKAPTSSEEPSKERRGAKQQQVAKMPMEDHQGGGDEHLVQASLMSPSQARLVGADSDRVRAFNQPMQQQYYDPMEVATNDMRQLGQFQNVLNQAVVGPNNLTSMTRFSRQIRDQSNTLQGRLPQVPNIPNIPQPPQFPNIPMPPPGMVQTMVSLALPFAMARATRNANRVRDQQVNAAAQNGGSTAAASSGSTGQRIFNRALTLTNRFARPRPRPASSSSSPAAAHLAAIGSSPSRNTNRNRFRGLVQTVVDMSRRPAGSGLPAGSAAAAAAAASSLTKSQPKLKPKVDHVSESRGKRLGRAINGWSGSRRSQTGPPEAPETMNHHHKSASNLKTARTKLPLPVIVPGASASILATMTDGSLNHFSSMTSPIDVFAEQLVQKPRKKQRRQVPVNLMGAEHHDSSRLSPASSSSHHHQGDSSAGTFEIIEEQVPAAVTTGNHAGHRLVNGLLPIPMVANHINLMLFTAQNVTGQLMRLPASTETAQVAAQQPEEQQKSDSQEPEQQQPEQTASTDGDGSPNGATEENPVSEQQQQQQEQQASQQPSETAPNQLERQQAEISESLLQQHQRQQHRDQFKPLASSGILADTTYGGRTHRPVDQQAAGSQATASKLVKSQLMIPSVLIANGNQVDRKEVKQQQQQTPTNIVAKETTANLKHEQHLTGASPMEPVVAIQQPGRDPANTQPWVNPSAPSPPAPLAPMPVAEVIRGKADPMAPLIPMNQFVQIATPTNAPDRWHDMNEIKARNETSSRFTPTRTLKSKRSTTRPMEWQQRLQQQPGMPMRISASLPAPVAPTTATITIPSSTTTTGLVATTMAAANITPQPATGFVMDPTMATTPAYPMLAGSSTPHSDDYVRAIRLVRGVAYPWAPPTKSSIKSSSRPQDV